jgi:hypothetical protein
MLVYSKTSPKPVRFIVDSLYDRISVFHCRHPICWLFYSAVKNLDYISENGDMINEWWSGRNSEGNNRVLLKALFWRLFGLATENHEEPCQNSRDSKQVPPEKRVESSLECCMLHCFSRSVRRTFWDAAAWLPWAYAPPSWSILSSYSKERWLRHYATSRKDREFDSWWGLWIFMSIYLILPALWPCGLLSP